MKKLLLLPLLLLFACSTFAGAPRDETSGTAPFTATATIKHIELEGGFYGILTDDGRKLDPRNLPKEFMEDGLRVRVTARTQPDVVGFHMWGTIVRIEKIEKL